MPELPEVETIRRGIEQNLVGQSVLSVTVDVPQILKPPVADPISFGQKLSGAVLINARRRGKHLIFGLSNGYALYAHLNMRGQFKLDRNCGERGGKYLCATINFTNGVALRYEDIWRWGEIRIILDSEEELFRTIPALENLGDEPVSNRFNGVSLESRAQPRLKSPIKSALLDQSVVAGVGNIYADESLYRSGIAPLRKVYTLTKDEWQGLATELKNVLIEATACGGTESDNYVDVDGRIGSYRPLVYGRANKNCAKCATLLLKTKLSGRGTVYCPYCQN